MAGHRELMSGKKVCRGSHGRDQDYNTVGRKGKSESWKMRLKALGKITKSDSVINLQLCHRQTLSLKRFKISSSPQENTFVHSFV